VPPYDRLADGAGWVTFRGLIRGAGQADA
jgi:hypothetical protein